jgi:hypothetical protein
MRSTFILVWCQWNLTLSYWFSKITHVTNFLFKKCTVKAEVFNVDRQTDMTKLKGPIHSQLNSVKLSKLRNFWQAIAQASELSFPVVFKTQNCAVYSGNSTVFSVYLPTPRWYHLKALNSFSRWASHDIFLFKYHFLLHILRFLFFLSDNMTDVASKYAQEHIQNWQKTDKPDGKPVLCHRTFSSGFCASFSLHS